MLNTGSRLEGLNKTIGTRICVSGEIVGRSSRHGFRPVGSFVVKGRQAATEVFEPLASGDLQSEWIRRYEAAFRCSMADLPEAAEQFALLHRDYPEDPCISFHCQRFAAGPTWFDHRHDREMNRVGLSATLLAATLLVLCSGGCTNRGRPGCRDRLPGPRNRGVSRRGHRFGHTQLVRGHPLVPPECRRRP